MTKPVRVRMDPKWKKRWLKALRSDKYTQATGALKDDTGFCCLGVLCDVVTKTKDGGGSWEKDCDGGLYFGFKEERGYGDLPKSVVALVKLPDADPEVASGGKKRHLSRWNDGSKFTFEQIANIIEREL